MYESQAIIYCDSITWYRPYSIEYQASIFTGTFAAVWVWPKVIWVARTKTLDSSSNCLLHLWFLVKLDKIAAHHGSWHKVPNICEDTVGNRPKWSPCFLLAGDTMGTVPIGSLLILGHFPKCFRYSVSIAEKISNTPAFPKEPQILFRYCSNGL